MKNLVIIAGPTGVGKTPLAIDLALQLRTKIVSADSRQCFKELGIAVAKPTPEELLKVPHYFINSHSVNDAVDARVFELYAREKLVEIFRENDFAIIVGGTGLYLQAVLFGLDEVPEVDSSLRQRLRDAYQLKGLTWLQAELQQLDPVFYATGEIQNPSRSLRALEVIISTGKSILSFHSKPGLRADYNLIPFNLQMERSILYDRISKRVDAMVAAGLVDEARQLYPLRNLNALQTVGYKELFDYFNNKIDLESAINLIKQNTRNYAKRQVTWFKKMEGFMPVEANFPQILTSIEKSSQ